MGPLFGTYELRLADAHLASENLANSLKLVGIDSQASPLDQGYSLIQNVANAISGPLGTSFIDITAVVKKLRRADEDVTHS